MYAITRREIHAPVMKHAFVTLMMLTPALLRATPARPPHAPKAGCAPQLPVKNPFAARRAI